MTVRFDDNPTAATRSLQMYLILIGCGMRRETLRYGGMGERVYHKSGISGGVLGPKLDPLMHWLRRNRLPPLTVLIVGENGEPGNGWQDRFLTPGQAREQVFDFDWYAIAPPTIDELERAKPMIVAVE